jgi:hypothetical protein
LKEISGRWLKAAPPEAKKSLGQRFNALKALVETLLDQAAGTGPSDAALAAEAIDITLPGTRRLIGAEHPITRTLNEITQVFAALGYSVGVGPEVGYAGDRESGTATFARSPAAAHAYIAGADADHGIAATAGADHYSRQSAPQ